MKSDRAGSEGGGSRVARVSRFQHTIAFSVLLASVFSAVVRVPPTMNDDWSTGVVDEGVGGGDRRKDENG